MDLNLEWDDVGNWPAGIKLAIFAGILLLIVVAGYWFVIKDQRSTLESEVRDESKLFAEFEKKQGKAANLETYKEQLEEMRRIFGEMLRQLPSKSEMPDLLVDVSQTALATGIRNELFKPGSESPQRFYAEKPIELRMVGSYHEFGSFVSGVASLPRIVILTMHDIAIKPEDDGGSSGALVLEGTAKTYRYLDEDEIAAAQAEEEDN